MNVAELSESALAEHEVHAERACFLQYSGVGDLVLPSYTHDTPKAAKVETLQAVLLSGIGCPGHAAVKQGAEDARHLELDFDVLGQLIVVPHSLAQLGHDDSSFVNALVNFFVRLLVTVESR